jgi:hypothetical protein
MNSKRLKHTPSMTETVKADPIRVPGHELVPLVRVTRHVRRRALLSSDGFSGGGWGYVCMKPVAILDRSGAGEYRHRVRDETSRPIMWLCAVFLVIPIVSALIIWLSRTYDNRAS